MVIAWPQAEIAVMGAEGAANIIFRREIKDAEDLARNVRKKLQNTEKIFQSVSGGKTRLC